tara:strand:- start:9584 stop:11170 length:1587 start_codon:yes stop_codon:yes gene_type:complete
MFYGIFASSQFIETARVVASDRNGAEELGIDVSVDGNFAIAGAQLNDLDATGGAMLENAGAAYIYEKDGSGNWSEIQKLVASDRELQALFGLSVSISGSYAVVGAQLEDKDENGANPINNAGAAYIFERDGSGNWNEVQKIVSSTRIVAGSFGISVAIEGNTILVGSHFDATDANGTNSMPTAGAVFAFERDGGGAWIQTQKIVASDRSSGDNFGVDVSFNENFAVFGANFDSQDAMGNSISASGTAYIFEKDGSGTWNQVQKIVGSDRGINDRYGSDVSIHGNIVCIGAQLQDTDASGGNSITDAGAAYVYEQDGNGVWNEVKKIVAMDRAETDIFGFSVSVDENYIAIGARLNDFDASGGNLIPNAGAAYIYEQNTGGTDNWGQIQKITASDRGSDDRFGHELILKNGQLLVGSPRQDQDPTGGDTKVDAGMFYVFADPTLSTQDNSAAISMTAYPNPFTDQLTISLNRNYSEVTITISNTLGQLIMSRTYSNTSHLTLPMNIASGMYVLDVTTSSNSQRQKIIKL